MISIALVAVLLAAEPAVDAGVPIDAPAAAVTVQAGELVPFDGVLLSNSKAIEQAKRIVDAEARAQAFSDAQVSTPVVIAVAVCTALVVGAAAAGGGYAVGKSSR